MLLLPLPPTLHLRKWPILCLVGIVLLLAGHLVIAPLLFAPISIKATSELEQAVELTAYELCLSEADPKVCNPIILSWLASSNSTRVPFLQRVISAMDGRDDSVDRKKIRELPTASQLFEARARALQATEQTSRRNALVDHLLPLVSTTSIWMLIACVFVFVFFGFAVESWCGAVMTAVIFTLSGLAGTALQSRVLPDLSPLHISALWGSLGLAGAGIALFGRSRLRLMIGWPGRPLSKLALKWPTGSLILIVGLILLSWAFDPRFTWPALGPAVASLGVGYALGAFIAMILRPNFDALFPWSVEHYSEINWDRLTEIDLRVVDEALALDPEFIDLRLKYLRSTDKLIHAEIHAKNINMMRLKIATKISSDWSLHLADENRWEKTCSSFKRMNGSFPWRLMVQSAPVEQRQALVECIRRAGHWVEDANLEAS